MKEMGHFLLCEGPASKTFDYVNLPTYWAVRHQKMSFSKTLFQPGKLKTPAFFFKKELFENDGVKISSFILFPCPSFSQTEIQKTGNFCVLKRFRGSVRWKTFDTFSEWNLRFQIPPVSCRRGLRFKWYIIITSAVIPVPGAAFFAKALFFNTLRPRITIIVSLTWM